MYSTHEAELDLPALPFAARHVHIVPALSHVSLLSIGQLCDSGCHVTFDAVSVTVHHHERLLLTGERTPATGLWHLSLVPPDVAYTARAVEPPPRRVASPLPCSPCAAAVVQSATPSELVAFAHAALFSPSLSTLHGALERGFLPNFLGLTARKLRTHPPTSVAMVKGHLDQTRKNQRSTKADACPPDDASTSEDGAATLCQFPPATPVTNAPIIALHRSWSLIRAKFTPTKLESLHARLVAAGLRPRLHRLDNECTVALKQFLVAEDIDFQLVPWHASPQCGRTCDSHIQESLHLRIVQCGQKLPLHLWDKLLPQAELTLNLLRGSRINPSLSAHAQLHGAVDFNRTPIAPRHSCPRTRQTCRTDHVVTPRRRWLVHRSRARVVPVLHRVALGYPRHPRVRYPLVVSDQGHHALASSNDLILAGIHDILHALHHPSPASPLAPLTDSHHRALIELTSILTSLASPQTNPIGHATVAPLRVASPTTVGIVLPPPSASVDPPLRVGAPSSTTSPPSAPLSLVAPRRVQFAPLPSDTIVDTFRTSTGFVGKRRRRSLRYNPRTPPGPTSKTIHPLKLTKKKLTTPPTATPARRPVVPVHHQHGTRANKQRPLHHIAAAARALLLDAAQPAPADAGVHYAFHGNAFNPDTGRLAEYRELSHCSEGPLWQQSNAEEIGRLAQGYGDVKGTNTMYFIPVTAIPADRKATYLRVVVASRPKGKPRRVRWTVGGDKVDYPFDVSTKTADLTTAKLLFNSVLSTPNAKFMATDLKDFYLGTPMERYEYMRIPIGLIPDVIIELYNLLPLVHNGHVFVEIRRGMYGLPQAGRLANDQLIKFMAPHGYHPVALTPGLWKHSSRDIVFSLVVDDFGIRYTSQADADHLITTLERHYQVSVDWTGTRYCGLTLTWDYVRRTCDLSMPGYIARALQRFQHVAPPKPEHSPHPWQRPTYGAKTQFAPEPDTAVALDATDKTRILEVLGTLLYYARAVDSTLLTAIGELATEQAGGTKPRWTSSHSCLTTVQRIPMRPFVSLLATCCLPSKVTPPTSPSSSPIPRSGVLYLTNKTTARNAGFKPNGAVHVLCQIMREVLSSAAEAELGALFHNGKEACPLRIALDEMGHPQPATPMATDNSTASGIATDTVKQKRSKAVDMRFYWIRDRVRQGQFQIYWRKGNTNRADYFSKHHPASHHQAIRSTYLYSATNPTKNYFDCLADTELPPTALALHTVDPGEGVLLYPGTPQLGNPEGHSIPMTEPRSTQISSQS
ncbi:Reverse transcriptase (RNA-dependent DNA polymerase) [Fragilaria crotonensis]|nr:Reverse transcriptase (RNA-dependent DNA polymerase) [Fragilaria crotonensis]